MRTSSYSLDLCSSTTQCTRIKCAKRCDYGNSLKMTVRYSFVVVDFTLSMTRSGFSLLRPVTVLRAHGFDGMNKILCESAYSTHIYSLTQAHSHSKLRVKSVLYMWMHRDSSEKIFFSPVISNPNLKRYARYAYTFRSPIKNIQTIMFCFDCVLFFLLFVLNKCGELHFYFINEIIHSD